MLTRISALRRACRRALPVVTLTLSFVLVGCASAGAPPQRVSADLEPDFQEGIVYSSAGGGLLVDACLPPVPGVGGSPAAVLLHGGGFTSGDRTSGGMRGLCEEAARQGIAAFSIDYRLAPASTYPEPVDDVAAAVEWLRQPEQVARFSIDPARIGALGSSAGAVLALTAATRGSGPTDQGSRLDAVVSLSGVSDFSPLAVARGGPSARAQELVLTYLGCTTVEDCPGAAAASPVNLVDPTDPPMLLVSGSDELVPVDQVSAMAGALQAAGVPHEELVVDGTSHGTSLLDPDVRPEVWSFMKEHL